MEKIKILLVDDHAVIRGALRVALEIDSRIQVVAEASNGHDAVELDKKLKPELIIIDIDMPGENGIEVIRKIKEYNTDVKIIVLTMHSTREYIYQAMMLDINGYFFKMTEIDSFIRGVHAILGGEDSFDSEVTKILMSDSLVKLRQNDERPSEQVQLTQREKDILKYLAQGLSSSDIASKLFISYFTVSNHRKNIMHKLSFKSTTELIKYAVQNFT